MEGIRDSLIKATVSEGAEHPSNKAFSTKEISKRCGVSEFTLFTVFKTKDDLVKAANDYVVSLFVDVSKEAARVSRDVPDYVKHFLYKAFEMPEQVIFLANYGFWTGKVESDEARLKEDFASSVAAAQKAFGPLNKYDDATLVMLWGFILRHVIYTVEFVYDGIVPDSTAYRDYFANLISGGVLAEGGKH